MFVPKTPKTPMISTRICKEFCRHNFEGQKNTLLRLSELTSSTIQMVMNSIPESKLDKLWTTSEIHLKCRFLAHTKRSSCKSLSHCIYPHCDPKPTCLEVFIVNSLVFKWPQPLFFMVLGAHGIYIYMTPTQTTHQNHGEIPANYQQHLLV